MKFRFLLVRAGDAVAWTDAEDREDARARLVPAPGDLLISAASWRLGVHPAVRLLPERECTVCEQEIERPEDADPARPTMHRLCRAVRLAARRRRDAAAREPAPSLDIPAPAP